MLGGVALIDGKQVSNALTVATDGRTAIGVPAVTANIGAEWDTPFVPGLTLTGRVIYTGSRFTPTCESDDAARVDES